MLQPMIIEGMKAFIRVEQVFVPVIGTGDGWKPEMALLIKSKAEAEVFKSLGGLYVHQVGLDIWCVLPPYKKEEEHTKEFRFLFEQDGTCSERKHCYSVPTDKEWQELLGYQHMVLEEVQSKIAQEATFDFQAVFDKHSLDGGKSALIPRAILPKKILFDGFVYVSLMLTHGKKIEVSKLYILYVKEYREIYLGIRLPKWAIFQIRTSDKFRICQRLRDSLKFNVKELVIKEAL